MCSPITHLPQTILVTPTWITQQKPADWLTEIELIRWQSFLSSTRRADWLAGRLAVKRLLLQDWDIPPLGCHLASDGIAPVSNHQSVPHINLTLSHSDGYGAASWSDTSLDGTVGIDIQTLRAVKRGLPARVLSDEEAQAWDGTDTHFLLFWALKEAAIKARRLPWGLALSTVCVKIIAPGEASITMPGEVSAMRATYLRTENGWLVRAVRPARAGVYHKTLQEPPRPNNGEPE